MTDANERVALVTGGTRGIGAAISSRLASAGTTVVAAYLGDRAAAERFITDQPSAGTMSTLQVDVGDPEACRELVSSVLSAHGRLDYLVNNAGAVNERRLAELSSENWDDTLRVNLTGAFHLSQSAIAPMRQAGFGRIVNIGSVTAAMGSPFVTCGATTGFNAAFDLRFLFSRQLNFLGSYMGTMSELREVLTHIFAGRLKPVVDRAFPLQEARAAHEYMEKSQMFGKIVLNI